MGCVRFDGEDVTHKSNAKKYTRKIGGESDIMNHASVPRKLRSVVKKRSRQSITLPLPMSRKNHQVSNGIETDKKNKSKKSKPNTKKVHITKDEEEVAETLYALAGMFSDAIKTDNSQIESQETNTKTDVDEMSSKNSIKVETRRSEAHKSHLRFLFKNTNSVSESHVNVTCMTGDKFSPTTIESRRSRKRCTTHVYISHLTKVLQASETEQDLVKTHMISQTTGISKIHSESLNGMIKSEDLLHKTTLQDQKLGYDFLSLGSLARGSDVNGSVTISGSILKDPRECKSSYVQRQDKLKFNDHHTSALVPQKVQLHPYSNGTVNYDFTNQMGLQQLQRGTPKISTQYYSGGIRINEHLPYWENRVRDSTPNVVNYYAHTYLPHLKNQLISPQHETHHHVSSVISRNTGSVCNNVTSQLRLLCNQHL